MNKEMVPTKIVCIGRNFVGHIRELANEVPESMVVFVKPNSSITNTLYATHNEQLHYEGELCFVYENKKFSAIGFGLDLTKRHLQKMLKEKGLPWERAKAFNGAALFSEFVEIPEGLQSVTFALNINGEKVQSGDVYSMIHKPEAILKEILSFMDLSNGDIVMTGTPSGVGIITAGDTFEGRIEYKSETLVKVNWRAE